MHWFDRIRPSRTACEDLLVTSRTEKPCWTRAIPRQRPAWPAPIIAILRLC